MQDRASDTPPNDDLPTRVAAAWPPADWADVHVAVAVSGGADSVALLRLLTSLKAHAAGRGELAVVHLDHRVRGDQATADAAWVAALAESLGVRVHSQRLDTPPAADEQSLRDARRAFYRDAAHELGARYLATGHTADDQAETVLFRMLRGSGLRGVAGVRPTASLSPACTLVRPLLGVTRSEVEAYLASLGQDFRDDTTNASTDYSRNWLRHDVLPLLAGRFPECRRNLATLAEHAAAASATFEALAAEALDRAAQGRQPWRLDRTVLAAQPTGVITEALRLAWRRAGWPEQAMTADAWRRLTELATTTGDFPAAMFPGAVRVEADGDTLVLSRGEETTSC